MLIPRDWLDYTLLAAILLGLVHWFGPTIRRNLSRRHELVHSFGGGVAVAYVFMSLFPEIELAHEWLGDTVHFVTLASFLIFLTLETRLLTIRTSGERERPSAPVSGGDHVASPDSVSSPAVFWWDVTLLAVYTWMVIFAAPERSGEDLLVALLGVTTVGLHLAYKDYMHRLHYDGTYMEKGRVLLSLAPFAGWVAHELIQPPEIVFDLFIAALAGILMQGIFRHELPANNTARLRWMLAGAGLFATLSLLAAHS